MWLNILYSLFGLLNRFLLFPLGDQVVALFACGATAGLPVEIVVFSLLACGATVVLTGLLASCVGTAVSLISGVRIVKSGWVGLGAATAACGAPSTYQTIPDRSWARGMSNSSPVTKP
uniref:Uncharacterized protein n=1 Tax=Cacopsylla melanoneura TaxID=428564 RepID=A0A8D8LPX3_9HEMI